MQSFHSQEIEGLQMQPLRAAPNQRMISREHCQNCEITSRHGTFPGMLVEESVLWINISCYGQ